MAAFDSARPLASPPDPASAVAAIAQERSWHAELHLGFERDGARTLLAQRRHNGPLRVQKPFYPEGAEACHVYVLHPPGGLVGGDSLNITCEVGPGAHAVVTTPAAGKVYRTTGAKSRQHVHAKVQSQALFEWLPQETIVFSGAKGLLRTRVEVAPGGRTIAWDIVCLGRPAAGERFLTGELANYVELFCEGRTLVADRTHLRGGSQALDARWGMGGDAAIGTLYAFPASADALEALRELPAALDVRWGCTNAGGVLIARVFAPDATGVRLHLILLWQTLRPILLGRPAALPRIWAT